MFYWIFNLSVAESVSVRHRLFRHVLQMWKVCLWLQYSCVILSKGVVNCETHAKWKHLVTQLCNLNFLSFAFPAKSEAANRKPKSASSHTKISTCRDQLKARQASCLQPNTITESSDSLHTNNHTDRKLVFSFGAHSCFYSMTLFALVEMFVCVAGLTRCPSFPLHERGNRKQSDSFNHIATIRPAAFR